MPKISTVMKNPARRIYSLRKASQQMLPEPRIDHPTIDWPPIEGLCRAVIGRIEARPIQLCGAKCVHGSSWCDFHYSVVFNLGGKP